MAGAFNGVLVTALGLPSLVVTLGTMALFRGIGYVILGSGSVNVFPDAFTDFGIDTVGSILPWTIVPFLVLAPVFAVVLQKSAIGRRIYAIGGNPDAARYAGRARRPHPPGALRGQRPRLRASPASCSRRGSPMRGPTMRSASSSTSSPSRCSAASTSSAAAAS